MIKPRAVSEQDASFGEFDHGRKPEQLARLIVAKWHELAGFRLKVRPRKAKVCDSAVTLFAAQKESEGAASSLCGFLPGFEGKWRTCRSVDARQPELIRSVGSYMSQGNRWFGVPFAVALMTLLVHWFGAHANAQVTVNFNSPPETPGGLQDLGFNSSNNVTVYTLQAQWSPAQLSSTSGILTHFGFQVATPANVTWPNVRITVGESTVPWDMQGITTLAQVFNVPSAPPVVCYEGPLSVTTTSADEYFRVPLSVGFAYGGVNKIAVRFDITATTSAGLQVRKANTQQGPNYISSYHAVTSGPNATAAPSPTYIVSLGASFTFVPIQSTPALFVLDTFVAGSGTLASGNNTVQAVLLNNGNSNLSSTNITLEYSTDGGATFPPTQSQVFNFPSFPALTSQLVSFSTPWNVSGAGAKELKVRINPPLGSGPSEKSRTWIPDVDVVSVSGAQFPAVGVPQSVTITLRNNGQVGLDNVAIPCRYTNDGTNYVTQTFAPATFPVGSTVTFTFSSQLTVAALANTTLTADISPPIAGDPDVTDAASAYLPLDGIHFITVGAATPGLGTSSTSGIPLATASTGNFLTTYTKEQLGNLEGQIKEFGFQMATGSGTITSLKIWMGETTRTGFTASPLADDNFDAAGPVLVYDAAATITPGTGGYFRLVLSTPYNYSGLHPLVVRIQTPNGGLSGSTCVNYAGVNPQNFHQNTTSTKTLPLTPVIGTVFGASFAIQARFEGSHARVRSVSVSGGGPVVGSNTVIAEIRNVGTADLSTTPITLEYSTDGGATWPMSQTFTVPQFFSLTDKTVTFTAPFSVSTLSPTTVSVRMPTPLGNGAPMAMTRYLVDADITGISTNPADPLPGQPNTVMLTVTNSGGMGLNGVPLQVRIRGSWGYDSTQTLTPTALASANSSETFTITAPWSFPIGGPQWLEAEIVTQPAGDPDIFGDKFRRGFPSAGFSFVETGTGTTSAPFGPPVAGPATLNSAGIVNVTQRLYLASDLGTLASGSYISSVAFYKTTAARTDGVVPQKLRVWLKNTTETSYSADVSYGNMATGAVLVHDTTSFHMPSDIGWVEFGPFNGTTPFVYTGGNLEVTVEWDALGQFNPLTEALAWRHDTVPSSPSRGRGQSFVAAPQPSQSIVLSGLDTATRMPHMRIYAASGSGPVIVNAPLLPNAFAAQSYTVNLASVGGGGAPYTYSVTSGNLPAGLSLSSAGVLSGTPSATAPSATPYSFTVTSSSGGTGTRTFSLTVTPLTVERAAGELPEAQAEHPYTCALGVRGGTGTYTLSIASGALPTGLSLDAPTLSIKGTPGPAAISATPYAFTVAVFDGTTTINRAYTLLVATARFEPLAKALERATGGGNRGGNVLNTYWHDTRLEAIYLASELADAGLYTGGWILGLSLKCAEVPGRNLQAFRIRLQSTANSQHPGTFATTPYSNSFGPSAVNASSFTVGDWRYFQFSQPFQYMGGNLMVDFTEDGTSFVAGGDVFMRDTGLQPRHLKGFGDSTQGWPFSTQNNGGRGTGVPAVRFTVATPLVTTFTSFPPAFEQLPYNVALIASGGTLSYTWSISGGVLPGGLTLLGVGSPISPASIFGSPNQGTSVPGTYPFTLTLTDGLSVINFQTSITVSVLSPVTFNPVSLAQGMEYVPYQMATPFTASGGTQSYTFTVSPLSANPLPSGLTLNGATGVISGTPDGGTAGSKSITFTVEDGFGSADRTVTLVIQNHPLQWRGTTLPVATATQSYNGALDAIGGVGGRIYSVAAGSAAPLPQGLFLAGSTGVITGTPALSTVGTHTITFRVQDVMNVSVNQVITLTVLAPDPVLITNPELPYAEVGTAYSAQLNGSGGTLNYTYTLDAASGPLPAGLALSLSGAITGTPPRGAEGRYELILRISDSLQVATKTMHLAVVAASSGAVQITEVDVATGYIEIMNTGPRHIDVSGWRFSSWVNGTQPVSLAFDTLPGASLLLRGEIVVLAMGGTAGGTWPALSSGSNWGASATSNLAVALYDSHGNAIDFVGFGSITPAALMQSTTLSANIPADLATSVHPLSNPNYSLGATLWTGGNLGTQGTRNSGLAATSLGFLKSDLRPARVGNTYSDVLVGFGGAPPYSYSLVAPTVTWLSVSASTGEVTSTGQVPSGAPASVFADVSVTDSLNATVTRTIEIAVVSASATPLHRFEPQLVGGQTAAGTRIPMPVSYIKESGAATVTAFSFVLELPTQTAAIAAIERVNAGSVIPATTTVYARRLTADRVLITGIPDSTPGSAIPAGEVAVAHFILKSQTNPGLYPVNFTEPGVVSTGSRISSSALGSLNISDFKPQDVNRDTAIDVVDVQLTVNIILAQFTPTYNLQGDANEDNTVDVVDVQTIVNCILGGNC